MIREDAAWEGSAFEKKFFHGANLAILLLVCFINRSNSRGGLSNGGGGDRSMKGVLLTKTRQPYNWKGSLFQLET